MIVEEVIKTLHSIEDRSGDFPNMTNCDWIAIAAAKRHLSTLKTKMESIIKWRTGLPDIEGEYLVTEDSGDVTLDCWCVLEHYQYWAQHRDDEVVAWCKLSDIKTYKE